MGVGKDGLPPVAGISEMAVRWPTMSASTRRPGAGKAEIHEAERTLARSRRERLTFALLLSAARNCAMPTRCAQSLRGRKSRRNGYGDSNAEGRRSGV